MDDETTENHWKMTTRLPLPIGVSDFKELVSGYYYVDKTLMLREFIDSKPKVTLFTRPRRFGKTLTMDMLKTFFEVSDTDTSGYFKDKKIWSCGEGYRREQGKYPVIIIDEYDTPPARLHGGLLRADYRLYA